MEILELLFCFAILSLSYFLLKSVFDKKNKNLPPGPISLPVIGHLHLLGPSLHHPFHKLSQTYGNLMYIWVGSQGCAVASSPEMAKELLKTHELAFSERMLTAAIEYLTYGSSFAFAPYGSYWKFIKKLTISELLGSRTLNQFLSIRTREIHRLVSFLTDKARADECVNVTDELQKLTSNVIAQMTFSRRCSGKEGAEARAVTREVTQIFGEFNVSDVIWVLKKWDVQGFRKRFKDIHRRFDSLLERIITARENERKKKKENNNGGHEEEEEERVKDFLDMMLDILANDDSELQLTRNHIKALILDFLTAATDTTAMSIEWALAELINHPSLLQKARKEIDEYLTMALKSSSHSKRRKLRLIDESDIPNLPYLQAIVKETFRLHPPIPLLNRKSIHDCQVDGGNGRSYTIPKNSMVFINMWAIGRDPKVWENPLEFQPERFLQKKVSKDDMIDVKGLHYQLLPFGSGRRGCPGISLAMLELPATLAALIQCFDWKVCPSKGGGGDGVVEGGKNLVDMSERRGLAAPRAHNLVCVPVSRFTPMELVDN